METPQPITTMPTACDMAREHCEQIYNDYREASHFDTVALMMLAYRKAKSLGRVEALEETYSQIREMRGALPKATDDDRSIMDMARELKTACDHFDAIDNDRRTLAREVNGANRVARMQR